MSKKLNCKHRSINQELEQTFWQSLDSAKWELWHDHVVEALEKILIIKDDLIEEKKKNKLQELYKYLERNRII